MSKQERVDICYGVMLYLPGIDGYHYPDSKEWQLFLSRNTEIRFYNLESETIQGVLKRKDDRFEYEIDRSSSRNLFFNTNYINWFVLDLFWEIYADIEYLERDIYKEIRDEFYSANEFKGVYGINTEYHDATIFRKIINDFQEINPGSEIQMKIGQNELSSSDFIPMFPNQSYNAGDVFFNVKSKTVLDYNACCRLLCLLDNYSTGCEIHNAFFKKHYFDKSNMFIDE